MKKKMFFIASALLLLLAVAMNWETVKDWACMLGFHHREVKGVWVSDMPIYFSREHDVNYCELLSESLDGNIDSFRKFVQIDYLDGVYYYDHSYRVCKVILSYSSNDVEKCLSQFSHKDLERMWWMLDTGLSFSKDYSLTTEDVKVIKIVMDKIEVKVNKKMLEDGVKINEFVNNDSILKELNEIQY